MSQREYRLLRELGTGTFGTVYQAELHSGEGFRKEVALKVLNPEWEAHRDAASRFRDEARLLGRLRHRHVVRVDGLVRVEGRWAVVMEYVPGEDTSRVIKACRRAKEAFPAAAALEVVGAVASALDAAWTTPSDGGVPLQVVHRDIKPSNIRLTQDGEVKVLDFGIARARFEGREAVTHDTHYGSIRYMSPERRRDKDDTPAGDVYALGCVLYECLALKSFGNAELEWAQHAERIHAAVLHLQGKGLREDVIQLLAEMLAFEARRRPSSQEVEERCREIRKKESGEELIGFARRFLPQVGEYVQDTSREVEKVLSTHDELDLDSIDDSGQVLREDPNEQSVATEQLQAPEARTRPMLQREATPPLPARTSIWPGVAAGAGTFVVLALAFAGYQLLQGRTTTLDQVEIEVPGATQVRLDCAGRGAVGTGSAVLVDVPAGTCTVAATLRDELLLLALDVRDEGTWRCAVEDGALMCHPTR